MKISKATLTVICILCFITNLNAQWVQVPSSPQGYVNNILNSGGVLFISHYNSGVFKSTDEGNSWQQINNGLNNSQAKSVLEILVDGDVIYAATVDGIYKSTDHGELWTKKSNGITIGPGALYEFCESIFKYENKLFTGTYNGIYCSSDNAENWTLTNATGEGIMAKNFVFHNGLIFAARESINFPNGYLSADSGTTWNPLTSISMPTITFLSEPGKLWAGTIVGVWLSTNNGMSWEIRNNGLTSDPYSSSIIRINGDLITSLKFGGSGMFRSTNDGLNWEDFSDGLPFLNSIEKLIVYNDKIIAATSNGLWQRDISQVPVELTSFTASVSGNDVNLFWTTATETNNRGFEIDKQVSSKQYSAGNSEWEKIGFVEGRGTTTESQFYSFTDESLQSGKYQYRLKQIDFNGSFEYSNEVYVEISSPNEFLLSQNYPNPFNPSTLIEFNISVKSFVNLTVYDALGNRVAVLMDEEKSAGKYEVRFVTENLSSGLYFYKLSAGNFVDTKKMILLK